MTNPLLKLTSDDGGMFRASLLRSLMVMSSLAVVVAMLSAGDPASAGTSGNTAVPLYVVRAGQTGVIYLTVSIGCSGPKCLRLHRTGVSAKELTRVTLPPLQKEHNGEGGTTLDSVQFANPRDGYAMVGAAIPFALYETTNGARTWRRVAGIHDLSNVNVSADGVLATTGECFPRSNCKNFRVWRESTATGRWTQLPVLWTTGSGPNDVYYGPAVASYGNNVWELETFGQIYLWTSENQGHTFRRLVTPALGSTAGCSLEPMSANVLWAQCPGGMEVAFAYSRNAGARWVTIPSKQFGLDPVQWTRVKRLS